MMTAIRMEMLVRVDPDRAAAPAVSRAWLDMGLRVVGRPIADAVMAAAPLPDAALRGAGPYGRPGDAWADLSVFRTATQRSAQARAFSEANWARFQDRAALLPNRAIVRLRTLDSRGAPFGTPSAMVRSELLSLGGSDWLQLTAFIPAEWLAAEDYQRDLLRAWRSVADWANPCFGEVADGQHNMTELERRLAGPHGIPGNNIPRSADLLRGYGWLTICGEPLAERLGIDRLRSSGAFVEVEKLDRGGVWLLATRTYGDYGVAEAQRVFHTLAPVLLPGTPHPPGPFDAPGRLVLRDARSIG